MRKDDETTIAELTGIIQKLALVVDREHYRKEQQYNIKNHLFKFIVENGMFDKLVIYEIEHYMKEPGAYNDAISLLSESDVMIANEMLSNEKDEDDSFGM